MNVDGEARGIWRTSICYVGPDSWLIHGYDIRDLIGRITYGTLVYLMFRKELPSPAIGKLMDAVLVSMCDYGLLAPSVAAARFAASGRLDIVAAMASGLLACGDAHGGAIKGAMEVFYSCVSKADAERRSLREVARELVQSYKYERRRIMGYGRPADIENEPNRLVVDRLYEIARKAGVDGRYLELSLLIEGELGVPLNLDGANGAILCELGFEPLQARAIFCISRIVGLAAEAYEEWVRERPFRQIAPQSVTYDGPPRRRIPREYSID